MWDRNTMHGFGDTPVDPNSTAGIVASIAPLVQAGLQAWDEQSIFDFNKQLISSGKAPLTTEQIQALMTGVQPQVNLGLSGGTTQLITDVALGAAVLIGGFLLLKAIK